MKVTIPRARELEQGVWCADVPDAQLQFFQGRAGEGGGRNLVVVSSAEFSSDGNLSFALHEARLANRAANQPTLFVAQSIKTGGQQTEALLSQKSGVAAYWVSVSSAAKRNLDIGIQAGVWGVKSEFRNHLVGVKKGDMVLFYCRKAGFTLCRIESEPFIDRSPVWKDAEYPHRVKISPAIATEHTKAYSDVSVFLRDRNGLPFVNEAAANRGISSHGGTFRLLSPLETEAIFKKLGWEIGNSAPARIGPA